MRGIFQVQLLEVSKKVTKIHGHQAPYFVIVSFIPEVGDRTKGISVAFRRIPGADQNPRLRPTISTFNVVPEDSEIITCIRENDLKGVQRLLDERKASTLDVGPGGSSLLFVSQTAVRNGVIGLILIIVCDILGIFRSLPYTFTEWSKYTALQLVRNFQT